MKPSTPPPTNCDQEQVQFIDTIQPFGSLVVARQSDGLIEHVSANLMESIGWSPEFLLGKSLSVLFDQTRQSDLTLSHGELAFQEPSNPWSASLRDQEGNKRSVTCLSHHRGGNVFYEFFHGDVAKSDPSSMAQLRQQMMEQLRKPNTIQAASETAVRVIRALTGYDRVMFYRFHPSGHGEVTAESTSRGDRFLGLHYPATDIPEPARRQLMLNKVRVLMDTEAQPMDILHAPSADEPLDLSLVKLRAVSPIHITYLRNMGTQASLTLSVIVSGKLWGMVACHHYSPKTLSAHDLYSCDLAAQMIELFIEGLISSQRDQLIIKAQQAAVTISQQDENDRETTTILADVAQTLAEEFNADAVAAHIDGKWVPLWKGSNAPLDLSPLHAHCNDGLFTTDRLKEIITVPPDQQEDCAGVAFLSIDPGQNDFLALIRNEYRRSVDWAGPPAKPAQYKSDGTLHLEPRRSFEKWTEAIEGKSKPFAQSESQAMMVILQAVRSMVIVQRNKGLQAAKTRSEEIQSKLRHQLLQSARSASLGELAAAIAHELNQPLTSISNFASASHRLLDVNEGKSLGKAKDLMADAVAEAQRAGQILHHLRNLMRPGYESKTAFDMVSMVEQAAHLALIGGINSRAKLNIQPKQAPLSIFADRMQLEQVIFNLVRNAVESMEVCPDPKVTITLDMVAQDTIEVNVYDTGPGISSKILKTLFEPFNTSKPDGMGIGLSLCRSTIETHGGKIWGKNTLEGACFGFTVKNNGDRIQNDP